MVRSFMVYQEFSLVSVSGVHKEAVKSHTQQTGTQRQGIRLSLRGPNYARVTRLSGDSVHLGSLAV